MKLRTVYPGLGWADSSTQTVRVGARMYPVTVDVHFDGVQGMPELDLRLEVIAGVPQCREATVRSVDKGREVQVLDLRAVDLQEIIPSIYATVSGIVIQEGTQGSSSVIAHPGPGEVVDETAQIVESLRRKARHGITDDFLKDVAKVYRENASARPVESIKRAFMVEYRTAAGYVERARKAGHLPPTTPGKRSS